VKLGSEKVKQLVAIVLMLIAAILVVRVYRTNQAQSAKATSPRKASDKIAQAKLEDPRLHLELLERAEAIEYTGEGKNIFRERAAVELPKLPRVKVSPLRSMPVTSPPKPAVSPSPPPPPPINLTFFGFSSREGEKRKVFLTEGDNVWIAHEGDVVNRHYRIIRILPNAVEVEDLLTNNRQTIPLKQG
jgi:hypothetical protein